MTVDDDNSAIIQHSCIPLAQHISPDQLETELGGLTSTLKVKFRSAHETYVTNAGQGLQQSGQLVEGLIQSIAGQSAKKGIIAVNVSKKDLADVIDALYQTNEFKNHRAALGGARDFIKEFRNTASHAPKSAKQAADKFRKCKAGFLDGINVAKKLSLMARAMDFQVRIYTT
jgi:hypothetical protein